MAYYEQAYNTATPALAIMTSLQTWMPANGYVFVETYTSGTNISDVYRSPGTLNSFGTDFFIAFNRTATTAATVAVMVFEEWDAVNKRAVNYAPSTGGVAMTPASDGSVNDSGVLLSATTNAASCNKNCTIGATASVSSTVYINITVDRIIWGNSQNVSYSGYAGLYDSFTTSAFPLVVVRSGYATSTPNNSATSYGAVTREPWIASSSSSFGAAGPISQGYYNAWPVTSLEDANNINSRTGIQPSYLICIYSSRNQTLSGVFGTFKDWIFNNQGAANGVGGDTLAITVGATTYNYVKPAGTSATPTLCWIPKQ